MSTHINFNFDNSYTLLPQQLFTPVLPSTVPNPTAVLINNELAKQLGLNLLQTNISNIANIFSGNTINVGAMPIAQAYAGHQFGYFNMLGDGRAILLGEHITPTLQRFDVQLKGSGQTPYSRRGDGKATYYSMLREYVISEAMHHLGIPTSRSLAVVTTGQKVNRETEHDGAILTRIAGSHIRVGTFEYVSRFYPAHLKPFTNYVIQRHYPAAATATNPALAFLNIVMDKQIELIVHWMRVGFIHGVMNTDNMLVSGETLDYGPCAFMNSYSPSTTFSAIDQQGRYAYGNQPAIAQWNIAMLATALLPLIHDDNTKAIAIAQQQVNEFTDRYKQQWLKMMCNKLGILQAQSTDEILINELLQWMQANHADYTNTFLILQQTIQPTDAIYNTQNFIQWQAAWKKRLQKNNQPLTESIALMQQTNPACIARNYLVEEALLNVTQHNNFDAFNALLQVLATPYQHNNKPSYFQAVPTNIDEGYNTFCGT
jgi:uncharacterized protein YdiU (UPF0061 family)